MKTKKELTPEQELAKLKKHHHELLEATTLSGAVVGATAGVVAGPPGMVVGGVIGTAIGAFAGAVLEREAARETEHDHDLDDAIGITSGDMGARESAVEGLKAYKAHEEAEALQEAKAAAADAPTAEPPAMGAETTRRA